MSDRVFIIGAGRVGRGLALALRGGARSGPVAAADAARAGQARVIGVHARTAREGATSAGAYPRELGEANIVVIAVSDDAVDGVAASLLPARTAAGARLEHATTVLHTSGAVAPASFDQLRGAGFACGTFHPLVPFSSAERGALLLHDGWIGIDGDPAACAAARRLAAAVGARTVSIPRGARALYHAAAVMASNFPVVCAALAVRTLRAAGVDEHAAEQVVHRLLLGAAENVAHGTPASVLTGPAARGDRATIAAHRAALGADTNVLAVYDALTHAAEQLAAERLPAEQRAPVHDAHPGRGSEAEGAARK